MNPFWCCSRSPLTSFSPASGPEYPATRPRDHTGGSQQQQQLGPQQQQQLQEDHCEEPASQGNHYQNKGFKTNVGPDFCIALCVLPIRALLSLFFMYFKILLYLIWSFHQESGSSFATPGP